MWALLERVYPLNKLKTRYVSVFLDENLTPQVKIVCSSRAIVLNRMQWFILSTFKDPIPKDVIHELRDSNHTLELYCGRYIRITSDDVLILLSKSQWSYLKYLGRSCINRQIIKMVHLYENMNFGVMNVWNRNLQKQDLSILKTCMMK
jgi:hypothetical protein